MVKSDGLNEVRDKNLIFQNDRLATATRKKKKMPKNPQIVYVKNTNTHKYPQKAASGQGRRPRAGAEGPRAPAGGLGLGWGSLGIGRGTKTICGVFGIFFLFSGSR